MKIVFFGTSVEGIPALKSLAEHHDVVAVVTSPDARSGRKQVLTPSPLAQAAETLGLPVLKPLQVKSNPAILQTLTKSQADVFVVVSYGKILPTEIINLPPLKTLNIHFSLLPAYRGASPIQSALLNGDTSTGTTVFMLEPSLDTGPIIAQEDTTIDPDDTMATLAPKMSEQSAELLLKTLPDYASGKINPKPQNHALATFAKIIHKQDGEIDWAKPASQIYNQYRAFTPWPGIWTKWQGKIVKILGCMPLTEYVSSASDSMVSGTVSALGQVACGQNTLLQLKTVQLEGKKPTDIQSFMRGYPQFVGSVLGK